MRTIKVKEIIEARGLDIKEVALQLFPKNKYPVLALNRVIKGKHALDADQISKLALMAGLQLPDLFSGENWKATTHKGVHVFTNGEFRAELDPETWITRIFCKDSMFHESIIHSGSTPVSEYLNQLDIIINNFKNQDV